MIEFRGRIDQKLYARALRRAMRGLQTIAVIWVLVALYALRNAVPSDPATWGAPAFMSLFGIFLLLSPWLTARKAMKTGATISAPFTGSADETRFVQESSFGRIDVPWTVLHRAMVLPDMVLLYTSAQQVHILVRDFFASDDDWQRFRELARRSVPAVRPSASPLRNVILWIAVIIAVFLVWSLFRTS